jgi:alkylation response protein AidB-like acyl-CoA dehydrogenase
MDFSLDDEQLLLQRTAREFVERVCPPRTAKEWDDTYAYPKELFDAFVELDWIALPFPEELGGVGAGPIETAIIVEELGRASFDVAMCFVTTLIPGLTVLKWAEEPLRTELVQDVIAGRRRLATAISEAGAGSDVAAISTVAEERGDSFVLNGSKMWCTGAGVPGTTIATYVRTDPDAKGRDGISLLLVDPTLPGVELQQIPTLARHTLGTYEVVFTDVEVPSGNLVGPLGGGWKVLLSGLDLERVLITAGYVGAAQSTLDEAVAYAHERVQFGRPIGDFQALSHGLADLHTEIGAARLLTYHAAWLRTQGLDSATAGAMAKLFASETYVKAARWGMQVMAGYGFSTESVMSFRYRESIVATISGGTSQMQRNAIARSLGFRTR